MKSIKQTVRENIRRLRLGAGLSQQKLAERTGKSLRYVNYLENRNTNVTIEVLEAIARGIGVSVAALVSDPLVVATDQELPKDAEPGLRYLMSLIAGKLGISPPYKFKMELVDEGPLKGAEDKAPSKRTLAGKGGSRKKKKK